MRFEDNVRSLSPSHSQFPSVRLALFPSVLIISEKSGPPVPQRAAKLRQNFLRRRGSVRTKKKTQEELKLSVSGSR